MLLLMALMVSAMLSLFSYFLFPEYLVRIVAITLLISSIYLFAGTEKRKWAPREYMLFDGRNRRLLTNACLFFLNLSAVLFTIVFSFSILSKTGILRISWPDDAILAWFVLFVSSVFLSALIIENVSRMQAQTHKAPAASAVLCAASIALSLFGVLVWEGRWGAVSALYSRSDALGILNLAALLNVAILLIHEDFPNVIEILSAQIERTQRRIKYYKSKSGIWLFLIALLSSLLICMVLIQLQIIPRIRAVPWEYALTLISIALALLVIVLVYLAFPRRAGAIKRKFEYEEMERAIIYWFALALTLAFAIVAALMSMGFVGKIWGLNHMDFSVFAMLSALGPVSFYTFIQNMKVLEIEERFADFLYDLAESRKAGMTVANAIKKSSAGDYGLLTPHIEKMSNRLSLGLTFIEVLGRFSKSIRSRLVRRGVTLVTEAFNSGGNIADAISAAARDIVEIKHLEKERRTTMSMYVMVVYISFFVFLFTDAVMYSMFLPALHTASAAAGGGMGGGGFIKAVPLDEMRFIYFAAAIVQALGNGL
ncbi:MAG: hypothetical protein CVT47_01945, partial [Thermoplasmata archaeon HGW-Thermoplasmata-2]